MREISFQSMFLAIFFACCICGTACAEDFGPTARGMFTLLPTSIFDSTTTGMTEAEKQDLLATGRSTCWELGEESPDYLAINALPFHERAIGVRIFRNSGNGSTEVVIGTLEEPICSLEMWRMDMSGRLVPVDTPEEPVIDEFFSSHRKLPSRIKHGIQFCLGSGVLQARPIFWNERGMLPAKLDNNVIYEWTGESFAKKSVPNMDPAPLP